MNKYSIYSFYSSNKRHFKHLIIFIWISFSLHLYLFWFFSLSNTLFNNKLENNKKTVLHNIILETKKESLLVDEEALISDKNNINQSLQYDDKKEQIYNVINLNEAQHLGRGGTTSYIPQESKKEAEQKQEDNTTDKITISTKTEKNTQQALQPFSEGGGDVAPTLYDVNKNPVINLYNTGNPSLATYSKEYADYFIGMKNKIEKYHKEFFPIYQYYQGLLKNGEVVVEYQINSKGDIVDAKVVSSYGSQVVDNASLNSVVYARNFGVLPKDLKNQNKVTIRFHFVYIVK